MIRGFVLQRNCPAVFQQSRGNAGIDPKYPIGPKNAFERAFYCWVPAFGWWLASISSHF
jgi:hypothetical protein